MKRKIAMIAAGMLIAASGVAWGAGSGEYKGFPVVNVVVNGKTVQGEAPGINLEGTTLVPLRAIGESLGAKIGWDSATSTATLTIAANTGNGSGNPPVPKPVDKETEALHPYMIKFSEKIQEYYDNLPVAREKIRIAKEFYEIRGDNFYFQQLDVNLFGKADTAFTDLMVMNGAPEMNKAREKGYPVLTLVQVAEKIRTAMGSYKLSADHYRSYKQTDRKDYLDFYITNYSIAYEDELKAKEMLKAAVAELTDKMKQGAPGE
ncbi:stalk domain-containing protein [Paenibacillus oceani]|uniref:Copper amine oxidase-like N-terminal domain-containing protein n=1 Tax=Paenibacillus oceani TaxID=2772510 RepID=A0A927C8R5_9BACL|nr:stalk domain-containing protein [Paenibacillus oceani]MBD2862102.1 hypothetical protein [Paenibacillus oceani]